jgi:hypothetical protein
VRARHQEKDPLGTGRAGYEIVVGTLVAIASTDFNLTTSVNCPVGKRAIGGGVAAHRVRCRLDRHRVQLRRCVKHRYAYVVCANS